MALRNAPDVLADLEARGLVQDTTDREALAARLRAGPVTLYHGIDPSADSLHIGNLLGVLALRRFQEAGHRPIALAGGATGMIGDPGGRSEERNLLDEDTLAANLAGIRAQLERFLDFDVGEFGGAQLVDNATWTAPLTLLAFLRDVGKHVTVNTMVAKDSVRSRLQSTHGISYTEFSYMLLQANDFHRLHTDERCDLQIGGSDQWGNITAGIDLIRRRSGAVAHGLTWPLLLRADGKKFGKSEAGNVWLSVERTSPYAFYQYWVQVLDADVRRFLLQLTLLGVAEVDEISAHHREAPERRHGQRRLAQEVTTLVHGKGAADAAAAAAGLLFGERLDAVPESAYLALEAEVPSSIVSRDRLARGIDLVELLVETGLLGSKTLARTSLSEGSVYMNNQRVATEGPRATEEDLRFGRWLLLRRGKRTYHLVRAS